MLNLSGTLVCDNYEENAINVFPSCFIAVGTVDSFSEQDPQKSVSDSVTPLLKDLQNKVKSLSQELSSTADEKHLLMKELELVKRGKAQLEEEGERLRSEFSKLQTSVTEERADLNLQQMIAKNAAESLQTEVLQLQRALLGRLA